MMNVTERRAAALKLFSVLEPTMGNLVSRWYFWGSFSTQGMAVLHAKESCTVKGWRVVKQTISATVVHMN